MQPSSENHASQSSQNTSSNNSSDKPSNQNAAATAKSVPVQSPLVTAASDHGVKNVTSQPRALGSNQSNLIPIRPKPVATSGMRPNVAPVIAAQPSQTLPKQLPVLAPRPKPGQSIPLNTNPQPMALPVPVPMQQMQTMQTLPLSALPSPGMASTPIQPTQVNIKLLQEENCKLRIRNKILQEEIEMLRKKLKSAQEAKQSPKKNTLTPKRKRSTVNSNTPETSFEFGTILEYLTRYGGLSRYTLLDDNWHAKNSCAANQLFGFKNWEMTKEFLQEKFPGLEVTRPHVYQTKKGGLELGDVLPVEKCLCVKMMDRMALTAGRISLLFGVHERTIRKWREEWCAKWGFERSNVSYKCIRKLMFLTTLVLFPNISSLIFIVTV